MCPGCRAERARVVTRAADVSSLTETEARSGAWQPADISVKFLGQEGGMLRVEGRMTVRAPEAAVYRALTDYSRAPDIFSNIIRSTASMEGMNLMVKQICTWKFLMLKGEFELQLSVNEQPTARSLVFRLERSKFMKDFEGRWQVAQRPDGTCLVTHQLAVHPTVSPPAAIAGYTSKIFVKQVDGILQDLEAELKRQALS